MYQAIRMYTLLPGSTEAFLQRVKPGGAMSALRGISWWTRQPIIAMQQD